MKNKLTNGLLGAFAASVITIGSAYAAKVEVPVISCVGNTAHSINIQFTAGSTGAAAGFSLQYLTKAAYDAWVAATPTAKWGDWPTDTNLFCKVSMSGNANLSQWDLQPFESRVYTVGYTEDSDPGVSFSCNDPLPCSTEYVFRAFAHTVPGKNGQKKSEFTSLLVCNTALCPPPALPVCGAPCTLSQGAFMGGNTSSAGALALANVTFPVQIGSTYTLTFTSAQAVNAFAPGGQTAVLTASATNPTSALGNLASQTLALGLNLQVNAALGSCISQATICALDLNQESLGGLNLTAAQIDALTGKTFADVLAAANGVLGGSLTPVTSPKDTYPGAFGLKIGQLTQLVSLLNVSFDGINCPPSQFTIDHVCGIDFEE